MTGALDEAWRAARRAWPEVELTPARFSAYVAERLPDGDEPVARLHTSDLYLACACLDSSGVAIGVFIERVLRRSVDHLRRLDPSGALSDDVAQLLSERLFVWIDGQPPRISDYSGRGPIASWVRVAALRTAHRLRGEAMDEIDETALAGGRDPQIDYLKSRYREVFRGAFAAAIKRLSRRDRTVLRMSLLDGLSIDKVGRLNRVHRATAARWIESARALLIAETRRELRGQLKVSDREIESLCGLLQSQFSLQLSTVLK